MMIAALIAFVVLFGLIRVFDRDRDDLDNFQIATVAIVPVLVVMLLRMSLELLFPQPLLIMVLPPLAFIGFTFFLLHRTLEIPLGKAIAYSLVVLLVNEAMMRVTTS